MVSQFKNKKILIMGLGLHGGALSVTKWLLKRGALLTITDSKTAQQLKPSLDKLHKLPNARNIKFILGKHILSDFVEQDMIVQNPGVAAQSKYLKYARQQGIPIVNEAVLFFGLYRGRTIGITGTRGKSTTTTLLHKILKTKIKHNMLAGNIAVNPMLKALDKLQKNSWPVVELSSWHLENLAEYHRSPDIAVVTNVLRDHLNRYDSFTDYKKAKLAIVANQSNHDIAVLNADNKITRDFARKTKARVYFFSLQKKVRGTYLRGGIFYFNNMSVMSAAKVKLLGEHNLYNVAAAITVAKLIGVSNKNISKTVARFRGIDYRLQYMTTINGSKIYNDSTSTTPDACLAALKALGGPVTLIVGGMDKGLEYESLARQIKKQKVTVIMLPGSASTKLAKDLKNLQYPINRVKTLTAAWQKARQVKQDIVFSPAAASFNMFINEFDRARQFDTLVYGQKKKK